MKSQFEFSRIIDTTQLAHHKDMVYEATPEECQALAKRVDALDIQHFSVNAHFAPHLQGVLMTGDLNAQVTLECIATLQPLPQKIHTTFEVILIPHATPQTEEDLDDLEGPDTESFPGTQVDVGELYTQYLCLAVPVYPRSDADPVAYVESVDSGANPFDALKK